MRQAIASFAAGLAVVTLVASSPAQGPGQVGGNPPGVDAGEGPSVPEDWPEHWPEPRLLDPAEERVVESASYLYSTWYGSPQIGLSPAAALAAHRGLQFERFVQFGNHEYLVPAGSLGGAGSEFHFILAQAIVDAAFHLCPDASWPGIMKMSPKVRKILRFANMIGPGDSIRGFSRPNPVHCYWRHMPAAEWDGSRLVPPPRFEEVWGEDALAGSSGS